MCSIYGFLKVQVNFNFSHIQFGDKDYPRDETKRNCFWNKNDKTVSGLLTADWLRRWGLVEIEWLMWKLENSVKTIACLCLRITWIIE